METVTVYSDTLNNDHLGEAKGDWPSPSLIHTNGCADMFIYTMMTFSVKAINLKPHNDLKQMVL